MAYKIIILDKAKLDVTESVKWYDNISKTLWKRFLSSFKTSVNIIYQNPYSYQIRYDDVRLFILKTFPYLIHFSVDGNLIIIKAVLHTSRDSEINRTY